MSMPRPSRPERPLARIGLPSTSSRVAVGTVAAFLIGAVSSVGAASEILVAARDWVIHHFGWLFVLVATLSLVGVLGRSRSSSRCRRSSFDQLGGRGS